MNRLKRTIEDRGQVLTSSVLKVDTFLNHCIETDLMDEIGQAFADAFRNGSITKVMTIESGGIAPAYATAFHLGVPVVFAKKTEPSTMTDPISTSVHSFTKNRDYRICIEREAIVPGDVVLFIDDFLANGQAFLGVQDLLRQSAASLGGVGICIEKAWQNGRGFVRQSGVPLCILASIASMSPEEGIVWNEEDECILEGEQPEEDEGNAK